MKKFLFSLFILFTLTLNIFADGKKTETEQYKIYPLVITKTDHKPDLFRYKDAKKLEQYKLQPGFNSSAINAFAVITKDHKILFDSGINAQTIADKLREINLKPEDIDTVCITHMHFDHIGGLTDNSKKVFPNATLYVSQTEADANKNSDLFRIYGKDIKTFADNADILNFIKSEPAFGHTPGHTVFYLNDGNKTVVIWGDIIHAPVQFENPEVYLTYDYDPVQAESARKNLLKKTSDNGYYVAGAHLLNNGIGKTEKTKEGYKFTGISQAQ